jgi:hypothetical protein
MSRDIEPVAMDDTDDRFALALALEVVAAEVLMWHI